MNYFLLPLLLGLFAAAAHGSDDAVSRERIETAVGELEKIAAKTLEETGVPGIGIVVVYGDEVIYEKGFGVREVGKDAPIDGNTVFQVASVSKPIAATVLAAVVGEGTIDWDDRVIDLDPGFRMYDPYVTRELRIRDLLCHRSGLPDHGGDLLEDIGYGSDEILRRLRYQPPASSFRTAFAYTNFGFSEAGYAAAKACAMSWEELAAEKLFRPLGMNSTSYSFHDYAAAENRALLHVREGDRWVAKHTRQPDAQAPAGGASTTLKDVAAWVRLLINHGKVDGNELVSEAALAETHTPHIVTGFDRDAGRVTSYGLGWIVSVERDGRVFWKHSGAFALGMRSEVAVLPSENLGIVVLSNAAPTGVPEGLTESFFDLVLDGKLDRNWVEFANRMFEEEVKRELGQQRDYSHPPAKPSAALSLSAYAGKYENDYFGAIEVVERGDELLLRLGPKRMEFPLRHWDRDTFLYQPEGESAGGRSGVRFWISPEGNADRVLIENLDIHGLGTFSRAE